MVYSTVFWYRCGNIAYTNHVANIYVTAGRWNRWPLGLSLESLELTGCDALNEQHPSVNHDWWRNSSGVALLVCLVPWKNKNKNKRFPYNKTMSSPGMSSTARRRTDSPYLQNRGVIHTTHQSGAIHNFNTQYVIFYQHYLSMISEIWAVRLPKSSKYMHAHFPSIQAFVFF